MNPRLNFILGIVSVTVALTLAVAIGKRSTDDPSFRQRTLTFADPQERSIHRAQAGRPAGAEDGTRSDFGSSRSARASGAGSHDGWRIEVEPSHPRSADLAAQARQVKRYATGRLDTLNSKLGLDPAQQQRILPLLARSSQSYDPAIRVVATGSAPLPSAEHTALDGREAARLIGEELTPEQRSAWIEDSLDDMVLWQEIINDLTRRLDQLPPEGETAEIPEASAPPPPPSSGGGRNLFR